MSAAPTISRVTISVACSISFGGPSKSSSSGIWRMHRVCRPAAFSASEQRTIATLMMSAAVPWITVLTASRSPSLRTCQLRARSSGIWRRAAEERAPVPVLLGLRDRVLHELGDGREALEVAIDELLRLLLRDPQAVGEAVGGEPVDDPVVDHLGLGAHADVELVGRELEDGARGLGVHVLAAGEDVPEDLFVGDVGEDAQLDLAVVDTEQDVAGLRDEAGS